MKGYSIEYKLVTSIYGIEYKVVTSIILHLEYKWSTIIILQSRHTRGGGINIIYSIASIMVYHRWYQPSPGTNQNKLLDPSQSWKNQKIHSQLCEV